ncbi:hypothetical protein [Staphylococcus phage vB_SsapH-Golestan-105-M]|nr:hypothetical protein [Staphylococcus phage vB_SsapH-Golestan-105-M]
MSKETIRRQFSNAIEIMATTKEWWNFPKSFNTNKEFKIKSFKNDTLAFEVREGSKNLGSFVVFTCIDFDYDKLEGTSTQYMINYFAKKVVRDMFSFCKLQSKM